MAVTELVEAVPLAKDAHGVYRVGGTRVTLDIVMRVPCRRNTRHAGHRDPSLQPGRHGGRNRAGVPQLAVARRLSSYRVLSETQRRLGCVLRGTRVRGEGTSGSSPGRMVAEGIA